MLPAADRYLSFLHHAFNDSSGRFRKFMSYSRNRQEEVGSEDSHGRSIWALGVAVDLASHDSMRALASRLVLAALPVVETFTAPRASAFSIIGLHHYLQYYAGDTRARRARNRLAQRLYEQFKANSVAEWPWLEDSVTYDNAKLPHALLLAGAAMQDAGMIEQGLTSLAWLVAQQVDDHGTVSLIGNDGWLLRSGERVRFDQQPVEAMALVEACAAAWRITHDNVWIERARTLLAWFTGANEIGICMIDPETGGCSDGLHTAGANLNQGAESTLAWIIAALTVAGMVEDEAAPEVLSGMPGVRRETDAVHL
jgi:hypothetical protein